MLLLMLGIVFGLFAGLARLYYKGLRLEVPDLQGVWLVSIAFLPQGLVFYLPATRRMVENELIAIALVSSQLMLLFFVWFNRKLPGFWVLGLGLLLNFMVISLNGGMMPISPETVERLVPHAPPDAWQVGERLGVSKDIILPVEQTWLWQLSDRFLLPDWSPYRVAFSLGDVFIAGGAFWLLWALGQGDPLTHRSAYGKQSRVFADDTRFAT